MSEEEVTRQHSKNSRAGWAEESLLWHALELDEVESLLDTGEQGLSRAEAGRRLERYGPNHSVPFTSSCRQVTFHTLRGPPFLYHSFTTWPAPLSATQRGLPPQPHPLGCG